MVKYIFSGLFSLFMLTGCIGGYGLSSDGLSISLGNVQSELNSRMPIKQEFEIGELVLNGASVSSKDSDRLALGFDMGYKNMLTSVNGKIKLSAKPYFDKSKGNLYLRDLKFLDLTFNDSALLNLIPKGITDLATPAIEEVLKNIPVYQFKGGIFGNPLLKQSIRSIKVKDNNIVISFF